MRLGKRGARGSTYGFLFPAALLALCAATPDPAPSPKALHVSGFVRAYDFTRQNAAGSANQASFNSALDLNATYRFARSWSVGGSYLYANPFDGCASAADQLQSGGPCSGKNVSALSSPTNPDNTLPGFELSTLYQAYLEYRDPRLLLRAGDQLLDTPWANASDSRLKPAAFQGVNAQYALSERWTGQAAFMDRFQDRADSAFVKSTLLTATNIADASGAGSNLLLPKYSAITTGGFAYGRIGYAAPRLQANLHLYDFLNIAAAAWFDARWQSTAYGKPFLALQGGSERSSGNAIIGSIDSQVAGLQGGIDVMPNLLFTLGVDDVPVKSTTFGAGLPRGVTCTKSQIALSSGAQPFEYFLPSGTPDCAANGSSVTVFDGGWASPYTDSYATDPLFTTSISQGMIDRRAPGRSGRAAFTWRSDARRIRVIAAQAWYAYGTAEAGAAPTQEFDLDGTYFFSPVPASGPYHGFSLRERYADRVSAFTQNYAGSIPEFTYNRVQAEYDF